MYNLNFEIQRVTANYINTYTNLNPDGELINKIQKGEKNKFI